MKKLMVFTITLILLLPIYLNAQYLTVRNLPIEHTAVLNGTGLTIIAMVDSLTMKNAIDDMLELPQPKIHRIIKHWRGHTIRERLEKSLCFIWASDIALTPQVADALLATNVPVIGIAIAIDSPQGQNIYLGVMAHSEYVLAQKTYNMAKRGKFSLHRGSYEKDQKFYFKLFRVHKFAL